MQLPFLTQWFKMSKGGVEICPTHCKQVFINAPEVHPQRVWKSAILLYPVICHKDKTRMTKSNHCLKVLLTTVISSLSMYYSICSMKSAVHFYYKSCTIARTGMKTLCTAIYKIQIFPKCSLNNCTSWNTNGKQMLLIWSAAVKQNVWQLY